MMWLNGNSQKCIKQRTERVNVRPSVCEWGGQGKKKVEVFRQEPSLVGIRANFFW